MPVKVFIIILNWNGYEDTFELVKSLKKLTFNDFEIVIVDNHSSESEVKKLKSISGRNIQIIFLDENVGFSGGNNLGIKKSLAENSDYILILNNDTIVEPDFLKVLLDKFELDDKVGITAPLINYYDKPDFIWSAGGKIRRIRASGFAVTNTEESHFKKKSRYVGFASGCCLLIKSEIFESVGYFDENFFLYIEDTDFCYRVIKAGYKIYLTCDTKIYHKVGNSTGEDFESLPIYYSTRNRLYFAKKNFPTTYFITIIYLFLAMFVKSCWWIFSGKFHFIISVKSAFSDFFKGKMGKTYHKNFRIN